MKRILLLLALTAFVVAIEKEQYQQYEGGDNVQAERQKDILQLFRYVNQPSYYKKYLQIGHTFHVQEEQLYTKPEVGKEFFNIYSNYSIPIDAIFSLLNEEHLEQAIALYNIFFYAKDFETFLNVAIWARQNVNRGMFVYSLSVALVQRPDTRKYILPPIYEIFPQYFFSTEVLQQAQLYKQQYMSFPLYQKYQQGYVITANYTPPHLYLSKEQVLAYFTEDIGLNAIYYYYYVYFPFWLEGPRNDNQFAYFVGMFYPQLLAKYYTERMTNGLDQIQAIDFQSPYNYQTEFYPLLRYPNGLDFPVRPYGLSKPGPLHVPPTLYNLNYTQSGYLMQDYARRIRDAIDLGYVINSTGEKIEITGTSGLYYLWSIIGGNPSINLRYYGSIAKYAKYFYGNSYIPLNGYDALPSALELPETTLRDPMFYQIYTTLYLYFQRYLSYQPPYGYRDLELPGITIQGFEISRLITYFDYFFVDISNALYVNEQEYIDDNVQVQVRQQRLNHRPFTYKLDVQSEQSQDVIVKIFIGPKYDELNNEIDIYQYRLSFALLDVFNYTLQVGQNVIRRSSTQFMGYVSDRPSFRQIYNGMPMGYQPEEITLSLPNSYFGLPGRLMLPRGSPNGQLYQLYIFIGPAQPEATLPIQYPMDRNVRGRAYDVPNAYLIEVPIYFKEMSNTKNYIL